jgi:hypothetical protein
MGLACRSAFILPALETGVVADQELLDHPARLVRRHDGHGEGFPISAAGGLGIFFPGSHLDAIRGQGTIPLPLGPERKQLEATEAVGRSGDVDRVCGNGTLLKTLSGIPSSLPFRCAIGMTGPSDQSSAQST